MGYELDANKYNYKCLMLSVLAIELIWIATETGLFVVEKSIMRTAVIPITIFSMIVIIVLALMGLNHRWVKYVLITSEIFAIHIMGTMLTYHVVIFFGIPFLMAAHYQNKKMAIYTLITSLIGMFFVIGIGYSYGVCDLNMVAFTKDRIDTYGELAIIPINIISGATKLKVMAYFYFPRAVLLVLFTVMTLSIAESGRVMQQKQTEAEYESTHDKMTGVYNKNMYLRMISAKCPKMKKIAVVYFDVNGLKQINDNLGHEKGDLLIKLAAKTLSYFKSDDLSIFRMGGDEFVAIMENGTEEKVEKFLASWKKILEAMNSEMSEIKCEMASGYALGEGKDVEKIVEMADDEMYKNKIAMKGFAR